MEDTISPGLQFTDAAPRISRGWWAAIALVLVLGAASAWRLGICFSSVLACTR